MGCTALCPNDEGREGTLCCVEEVEGGRKGVGTGGSESGGRERARVCTCKPSVALYYAGMIEEKRGACWCVYACVCECGYVGECEDEGMGVGLRVRVKDGWVDMCVCKTKCKRVCVSGCVGKGV